MAKKLTEKNKSSKPAKSRLVKTEMKFKLCIQENLDNKYCFTCLKKQSAALVDLDYFISETVHKNLSISSVDKLYLRKKGTIKTIEVVNGKEREVVHYGKDMTKFRIHGYYNDDGYFVIHRIDPKHKVHKS